VQPWRSGARETWPSSYLHKYQQYQTYCDIER
jgi:hypothetical protein